MRLKIDPVSGYIEIDQAKTRIRGRWGAAALAQLIAACGDKGEFTAVDALALQKSLSNFGLKSALGRNQWKRVWVNAQTAFRDVGREEDFLLRFGTGQGQITTGPWRWGAQPTDKFECVKRPVRPSSPSDSPFPGLAVSNALNDSLVLSRKLANCHVLWVAGSREDAAQEFLSGNEWTLATPEVLAHRELIIADALLMASRCESAVNHLAAARQLIETYAHCKHHRGYEQLLSIATPEFQDGVTGRCSTADRLIAMLEHSKSAGDELDTRTRSWALTYAACCIAIDVAGPNYSTRDCRIIPKVVGLSLAGIYFAIAGGHYDIVPVAHENLQRNLTLLRYFDKVNIDDILDVYQCSVLWWRLIDPPQGFSIGRTWLGIVALLDNLVLTNIRKRIDRSGWLGPIPDSFGYYVDCLNDALSVHDPMHIARSALSCLAFSSRSQQPVDTSFAKETFREVVSRHPEIRARLIRDGIFLDILPR